MGEDPERSGASGGGAADVIAPNDDGSVVQRVHDDDNTDNRLVGDVWTQSNNNYILQLPCSLVLFVGSTFLTPSERLCHVRFAHIHI